jgi:hypothetical protein
MWAAFILVICLMPARHIPRIHIPNFDKVVHTCIYTVLGALTFYGWSMQGSVQSLHRGTLLKIIILLSLYGLTIEIMQETLTLDRHFEWLDEVANASGSIIGTCMGKLLFSRLKP